jgi:dethiobiotin synthetase
MRIVIVGTGTGIGKTHATRALLSALVRRDERVLGLKPIETGFAEIEPGTSDGEQLAAASNERAVGEPPVKLLAPLTPWLAAELEGVEVDLAACVRWVHAQRAARVLVESAGALLSPITHQATNLDLVRALEPDHLVLVAPDRLGVLHDVAACRLALERAPELPRASVILQAPERSDASTGRNAGLLERLGHGPVVGSLPRAPADATEVLDAADALLDRILAPTR